MKQYWNDETEGEGSLGDFVADTIAKQNSRVYGVNQAPGLDALDYLDKTHYSDDEWEAEEEVQTQAQALKAEVKTEKDEAREATATAVVTADSAASTDDATPVEESKSSFIELSDSEDEDEEEEIVIVAPTALVAPAAPAAVPALSAVEAAAQQRAQQIELLKAQAAEKERRELEIRRERYLAAVKAPRTSRSALLTTLRQKVAVTAKENYCNQRKVRIKSEELTLRLQIADKCRYGCVLFNCFLIFSGCCLCSSIMN